PPVASRVHQRNRPGKSEDRFQGQGHFRFIPRQGLQRTRELHLIAGGVHAQADPDATGAGETRVSRQDRGGESEPRAEVQHAGGCRDSAGPIMEPIIETRDLTRRFGTLTAVERLNLTVTPGEIFGLVGPDGAGKTTTLRMLCGLMDPTEGTARVAGHDTARDSRAVKDRIGYMAQRFGLYTDLTVEENMVFYADLFAITGQDRVDLSAQLLRMTRMEPFRDRQAGKLSGGMKQKLALMCTLLHRPEILFLDEPTNGVDPVSRRDFWTILYQLLKDGITIFL